MDRLWAHICVFVILRELQSAPFSTDERLVNWPPSSEGVEEWKLWKRVHNKSYGSSIENIERYTVWRANKVYIDSHNKYSEKFGFTLSMNEFGDLVCVHTAWLSV